MKYSGYAYVYTIGCQMNVYDSEKLALILSSYGFEKTDDLDKADIVVCNTCSIRHKAEEKAFSFLGRFAKIKKKKPHLITVMAGCVAQQEGKKAFERIPHLDIVLGTQAFSRFGKHIDAVKSGKLRVVDIEDSSMIYEAMPDSTCFDENKISRFVTIMQGCENFCTYCVVPYVRGRERSRDPEKIVEEITLLAESGVREVTLLGQNVNSYGQKEGRISFPQLLARINEIKGIHRIRFATSHPKDLSMDLIYAIRDLDKVCNHLHLPVQSGSNQVLKKMNRGYTREKYINRIYDLKKQCPDIALSTDMIVGFPSESKNDFYDTMNLLREIEFDSIFAFAYSNRSSAPAAKFPNQIDEKEKLDRLNQLLALQEQFTEKKNKDLVGKVLEVLVEGKSGKKRDGFEQIGKNLEQMTGRSESNKIVHFPSEHAKIGDRINIRIKDAYPHSLWGHPVGDCEYR
ncbi:tRNA (N6-isopentenyl adenosine(37)-C2)-methylthiotransferase MiaB [Desulfobacula toluolica]|uniref:tRNA-2-methylthio-N(6)-dimethylallyladenosine synthase n=1 Tax=Desulfobacula toluolica (strain DSM 7467 / Tol2) TaxID=651182 RepID=K0NFF5_DESTT|nr:tRNA (N6-isopentenyl adenosine(37)-C2)-methylthiotransferase MiaB [Desulfobacula toluolica]CCK79645.1 MiaB: (dimethylallyl)adenosine tRNA methylthiotransferase [Desulfobacula toluolica Tol2]